MSGTGGRLKDEGSKAQVVLAGATAGLVSRFVVAPLDVVKIRLQLQTRPFPNTLARTSPPNGPIYKGILPTLRHVLAHEGVTGLWKGNVPAELMYVSYAAVQFSAYRWATLFLHRALGANHNKHRLPPSAESFLAGAAAGATATAATYPLDLLRTRFAAQGNDRVYTSLRRAVADIRRDEGLRGFFRGLAPALGQIVPYMGLFFAVYESLRSRMAAPAAAAGSSNSSNGGTAAALGKLPLGGGDAVAGAVASVVAKTTVFPLDLVRKRMQVQGPTRGRYVHKDIPEYRDGAIRAIRTIVRNEGLRGLYRGLTVSLVKAAPASAVTLWTYERTLRLLASTELKLG